MKRTIYTLLATVILSIFSFPVFGQAGTISFNQSCSPGFSQQWPIDIKEAKNIRFTYSTDINSSGDVLVILELAADGVSYTLVQPSPVYGYGTGTICTNLKKGKGLVTFQTANSGSGSGTKKFDLKYEADNPINTTSDLNVGGNGTITGALTVKSTFTASSATASNSIIGKLGIGTTTPKAKLESVTGVNAYPATSNTTQSGAALRLRGGDNAVLDFGMNSINTWIQATDQTSLGLNYNISLNPNGGNVGIGTTTTPIATLDVNGSMHVNGDINAYNVLTFQDKSFRFDVPSTIIPNLRTTPFSMPIYGIASPLVTGSADLWLSGYNAIRMFTASNPIPRLSILYNGYVGIGSSNPDAMLTVNGTIHAKEVDVDVNIPADYVFKSGYKLMPLNDVEKYVKTNSHLPEIPSAEEITKNGFKMGEMQNKLLQKVEELTLYMIEQQKTINQQSAKIEELEKKLK